MAKKNSNKEIVVLDDFEHVLLKSTMYVGSVDISDEKLAIIKDNSIVSDTKQISVGFYKLMGEILDNAIDEAKRQKGLMKRIEIHFDSKLNKVTVIDTGGGFENASSINKKNGLSNVANAVTQLRAGSNFYNDDSQENVIGTNGVGAALVNMLSDSFYIKTINENEIYEQTWDQYKSDGAKITKRKKESTGTTVSFIPRIDKFKDAKFDKEFIHTTMIYKNFLIKNDPIISNLELVVTYDGNTLDTNIDFIPQKHIRVDTKIGTIIFWESYTNSMVPSFVNGAICTGSHQMVFRDFLNNTVFESNIAHRFYETFIILNLPPVNVRFGDQNKTMFRTGRSEISPIIEKHFFKLLQKEVRNSSLYDIIQKKIQDSTAESDLKKMKAEKRSSKHKVSDKYFPPSEKTVNLFLVEGGSASGGILQRRDSKNDGVYALKGKVKNAKRLSDLTNNAEVIDLMNILGIEPNNDRNCKFERVIIATDADPDGGHISSLLINLFYKWFPNVIRSGKLFILQTPLVSISESNKIKYFFNLKDFEIYCKTKKPSSIRYLKGLGSLNLNDWENVFGDMKLNRITEDSKAAQKLEMAFGDRANLRKKWMEN